MHKLFQKVGIIPIPIQLLKLPSSTIQINSCNHFSSSNPKCKAYLDRITVVGGGHMGTGIAQISAAAGNLVTIADINEKSLVKSRNKIEDRLTRFSKKLFKDDPDKAKAYIETTLSRIEMTTNIGNSVKDSDLVVEAIPEDIRIKHKMLREIDPIAPESAIFVTNTSSIPVHEIAEAVNPSRRSQFCGVHFFEPVAVQLVEVIRTAETTEEVFYKVMEWSRFIGKVPVACKDTPGFIVNRLNIPYLIDAVKMYERGDASIKDIDIAMKLGCGYPYGPFELADYIGIDVIYMIFKGWERRFANSTDFQVKCPETITQLYKAGKFGKKSGEGFYKH